MANLRISLMARGALLLKPLQEEQYARQSDGLNNIFWGFLVRSEVKKVMHTGKPSLILRHTYTPWMRLWILMVYSLVTTSLMAERPFFFSPFLVGAIYRENKTT